MSMGYLLTLVVFMIAILSASPVAAKTWDIQPGGGGDAPTIQAGIDSAAVADTVLLANGTFTGNGNRDLRFNGKDIVVTSMNGAGSTTIDCELSGTRGFTFTTDDGPDAVLSGVTIINGQATEGGWHPNR